ncbi:MAG: CARDB domain-containing protein [Puniceicoccaceae bacterium]
MTGRISHGYCLLVLLVACNASAFAGISASERIPPGEYSALQAIYDALDGPNWGGFWWNNPNATSWPWVEIEGEVIEKDQFGNWYVKTPGNVTAINLSPFNTMVSGSLPDAIGSFSKLESLIIDNSNVRGPIPETIGQLSNLEHLNLEGTFEDDLPSGLWDLTKLRVLRIYSPYLTGYLYPEIGNLKKLEHLYIYGTKITGDIPLSIGQLTELKYLYLRANDLTGSLPSTLSALTKLSTISLGYNRLSGSIPDFWDNFPDLKSVGLNNNQFQGEIPVSLGSLEYITGVYINVERNCLDTGNGPVITAALQPESRFHYKDQDDCAFADPADLCSTLMDVVENRVQSNEKITVRFEVENKGHGDAEGYHVYFYLMAHPSDMYTERKYLGKVWMPPLKAGETSSIEEVQFDLPPTIKGLGIRPQPNLFFVGMYVDAENAVRETDEKNNYQEYEGIGYDWVFIHGPAEIEMVLFDAHHVDHDGEGFEPGDTMLVDWTLENVGYDDSEPFTLEFLLDPPIGSNLSEKYLGLVEVDGLESGGWDLGEFYVDLPLNPSDAYVPIGNGVYMVKPQVRPIWLESFEFWNPYFTGDEVYGDDIVMMGVCTDVFSQGLVVLDFYDDIKPGDQVIFEYRYKNASQYPMTEEFTIGVFLSTDSVIDPDTDMLVYTKRVKNIGPNTNVLVPAQVFNLPPATDPFWAGGALPQTYYVGMVIDLYGELTDCDRSDNITTGLGVGSFIARPFIPPTVRPTPPNGNGSVQAPFTFKPRDRVELDCTPGGRFQMERLEGKPIALMEIIVEKQSGSGTIYFTADGSPPNPDNYIYKLEIDPDDPGPYSFFMSSGDGELRATFDMTGGIAGGLLEVREGGPAKPIPAESSILTANPNSFYGASVAVSNGSLGIAPELYRTPTFTYKFGSGLYDWDGESWAKTQVSANIDSSNRNYGVSNLGNIMGLSDDFLVVGDSRDKKIYIYDRGKTGWVPEVINLPELAIVTDISMSGNRFAAGIFNYNAAYEAAVVVYEWTGSEWETIVVNRVEGPSQGFGGRVSLSGDTLAVIDFNDPAGQTSHIFQLIDGVWTRTDRRSGNKTGYLTDYWIPVTTSGDVVAVGSPGNSSYPGIVHIYRRDGTSWNHSYLRPPEEDAGEGMKFGDYVVLAGNRLAVSSTESISIFEDNGTGWDRIARIEGAFTRRQFAFDGELLLIGSFRGGGGGDPTGKVYNISALGNPPPEPIPPELWPTYDIQIIGDAMQVDIHRHPGTDALRVLTMISPNTHDWAQATAESILIATDPDSGIETWRSIIPIEPDSPDTFVRVLVQE